MRKKGRETDGHFSQLGGNSLRFLLRCTVDTCPESHEGWEEEVTIRPMQDGENNAAARAEGLYDNEPSQDATALRKSASRPPLPSRRTPFRLCRSLSSRSFGGQG